MRYVLPMVVLLALAVPATAGVIATRTETHGFSLIYAKDYTYPHPDSGQTQANPALVSFQQFNPLWGDLLDVTLAYSGTGSMNGTFQIRPQAWENPMWGTYTLGEILGITGAGSATVLTSSSSPSCGSYYAFCDAPISPVSGPLAGSFSLAGPYWSFGAGTFNVAMWLADATPTPVGTPSNVASAPNYPNSYLAAGNLSLTYTFETPEPAGFALLAAGGGLLWAFRRRKR